MTSAWIGVVSIVAECNGRSFTLITAAWEQKQRWWDLPKSLLLSETFNVHSFSTGPATVWIASHWRKKRPRREEERGGKFLTVLECVLLSAPTRSARGRKESLSLRFQPGLAKRRKFVDQKLLTNFPRVSSISTTEREGGEVCQRGVVCDLQSRPTLAVVWGYWRWSGLRTFLWWRRSLYRTKSDWNLRRRKTRCISHVWSAVPASNFMLFLWSRRNALRWMICVGVPWPWGRWRRSLMTTTP